MSDTIPKLPGLSGKTEAELHKLYTDLFDGFGAPAEFDTVPKLTAEIKRAYAEKYPEAAKTPVAPAADATDEDAVPTGHIRVTEKSTRAVHDLPTAVWENLGARKSEYEPAAAKPASLPKA